jgi:hypothetical protein
MRKIQPDKAAVLPSRLASLQDIERRAVIGNGQTMPIDRSALERWTAPNREPKHSL